MRLFIIVTAVAALAAFPCAWDTGPGEIPPIATFMASRAGSAASELRRVSDTVINERLRVAPIESPKRGEP